MESRGSFRVFAVRLEAFCLYFLLAQAAVTPANGSGAPNYPRTNHNWLIESLEDGDLLEVNKPVERDLLGGETHFYRLTIEATQIVRLIVDQRGIDVVVRLLRPDGSLVKEVDSPNGKDGPEPLNVIVESAGVYRLSVSSLENDAKVGRYEAKLVERRLATPEDRHRLAGDAAGAEGLTAFGEGTRQALKTSLQKFDQALAAYIEAGDRSEQFRMLSYLNGVAGRLGEFDKAQAYANQALQVAEELDDKERQAQALNMKAIDYQESGEYDEAIRFSENALNMFRSVGNKASEAKVLKDIGQIFMYLGETAKAAAYFERALKLFQSTGNKYGEATTFRAMGYAYVLEDKIREGIEKFTKALSIWQTYDATTFAAADHSFISNEYARLGERQPALEHAEKALRFRPLKGDFSEGTILTNVGHTYNKLREFDKALGYYRDALAIWQNLGDKRSEAITLKHTAAIFRDQGRLAEAQTTIEKSIALLEFSRDRVGSPELRSSFVASLFEYYELYIDLRMRLHEVTPEERGDLAALAFVEKVKMRSLVELLTLARVNLHEGVDVKLLERERRVNEAITDKLDELASLLKRKSTEVEIQALEREVERLKVEFSRVQSDIREGSPHSASIASPQSLSVKDIQQRVLDNDTLLLEYKLGDERSYLWAVTRDGVRSYRLPPRAEIETQTRRVYELLTARQASSSAAANPEYWIHANKLSKMLIGPAASQLGTKRLLIVADGALQYLPFAVLPTPSTAGKSDPRPLVLDHEIVSLPSASVVDMLRKEYGKRQPAPRMAVVLADPVYATDDSRVKRTHTAVRGGDTRSNFQRLLFSREEAETILSVTPSQSNLMALDFESNRQLAMSPEMSKYRIVHFSTHGVLDSRRPELSGLVLSQVSKTGEPQEGFLRLHEIYNLRLNADLVVLSGCQTGLGKEVRGEGLIGLTRGFMYAGAPRVMASLWQVDDAATAALMKEFYRGMLVKKLTAAAALRAAQIEMLKKRGWRSPYYWGAFVLQGEWR